MTAPLTPESLTELRRLLDAANAERVMSASLEMDYSLMRKSTRALFVAAVGALPDLLDAAAERDALAAAVERVRALHEAGRYYSDHCDDPECDRECVELWVGNHYHADVYDLACETCSGGDLSETDDPSPWPCPTIRALDEEPQS